MVHHVSNTVTNAYDNCLEECQRSDEEHLLLMDMEIDDNQAWSCTQDDAICLDPDFSYDSQADDTAGLTVM